jgi:hypothetical protein
MSKKRTTSSGQLTETKVNDVVNRFNLLNNDDDNNDSDIEEVQTTKNINKSVTNDNSGSDNDIIPINKSKNDAPVDADGFQTVYVNKSRKVKQSVKVEKYKPHVKVNHDKDVVCRSKIMKHVIDDIITEKHVEKCVVRKIVNDVPKNDGSDDENNSGKYVKEHCEKKVLYIPPVSTDGWTAPARRRRFDRSERTEHVENENEENKDAKKIEYYDPAIILHGDEMKLNTTWTVWIHENDNQDWSLSSYKSIYDIDSIGSMWRFLWVLDNLNKNIRQYYIMRNGITPIWEDNNNKQGAICSIMIDNLNRSSRHARGDLGVDAFSAICILAMNESFVKNNQDINGLCYSIKSRSVLIKLWVKDYESNANFIDKLPITILKSLDSIISNMENKGHIMKSNGKSKVSVQIKQIKPNY